MEANIVLKAEDFTPDFADGILKVFGEKSLLHIRVQYELNTAGQSSNTVTESNANEATPKKRGRKPGSKAAVKSEEAPAPKKRGRKPKVVVE